MSRRHSATKFWSFTLIFGFSMGLTVEARAEEGGRSPPPPQPGRQPLDLKGAQKAEATRDMLRGAPPPKRGGARAPEKKFDTTPLSAKRIEGRILFAGEGDLLIERAIPADKIADFERMGFKTITDVSRAQDRTMLGTNVYLLYDIEPKLLDRRAAKDLVGKQVELEIAFQAKGEPIVTGVRSKR